MDEERSDVKPVDGWKKAWPLALLGVLGLWVVSGWRLPVDKEWPVQEFGRLPLVFNGRLQPMDSLARNSLLQIREKQSYREKKPKAAYGDPSGAGATPVRLSATEWLMEMFFAPEKADQRKVFRIDNPDLKGQLGLAMEADPSRGEDGKHFSWNQISGSLREIDSQGKAARAKDASERTPYERALVKLHSAAGLYMRLQNTIQPMDAVRFPEELGEYQRALPAGVAAFQARMSNRTFDTNALVALLGDAQRYLAMQGMEPPLVVPPRPPVTGSEPWKRMGEALLESSIPLPLLLHLTDRTPLAPSEVQRWMGQVGKNPMHPVILPYARLADAFRQGDPGAFRQELGTLQDLLAQDFGAELRKTAREQRFNQGAPFYQSMALYVLAFVLVGAFWVTLREDVRKAALWLVLLALVIHSGGILMRMLLEGRPPVTNLYSSAVFIGWGAVVLGLVLEGFWKNAIGLAVATLIGFSTLIIAHHLSLSGDTMEMMQAVLDTNFWLATHVVIVTLGYSSTYVAGFLSLLFIVLGLLTRLLTPDMSRSLTRMVYGIICFATLFSFVGTVLGGIWADQSWGRFWGWDPKENGALIIVLWNALILHARWGGLVREHGLHRLSIGGNIVTSWSWFGTNMLGIGFHSYGFMDAAFWALLGFVLFNLLLIGLAFIPVDRWRSQKAHGTWSNGPGRSGGDSGADSAGRMKPSVA
jgi:ABC-type transport system involved in cytochrome c biogenesis permease subunit